MLLIATDRDGRTGNALQLALDDFVVFGGRNAHIFHNGRMRGGVQGATKQAMLDWLGQEARHLLDDDDRVRLGTLPVDRRIEWSDVRELVVRCTEYAFAREAFMRKLTGSASGR